MPFRPATRVTFHPQGLTLGLLCLLLAGCGGDAQHSATQFSATPPTGSVPEEASTTAAPQGVPTERPSSAVDPNHPSAAASRENGTTEVVSLGWGESNSPSADAPELDGWDTEAFSERASAQLGRLMEFLTAADGSQTERHLVELFVAAPSATALIPAQRTVAYRDDIVRVERADGTSARETNGMTLYASALPICAPLREQFAGWQHVHGKFKLYRVEMGQDESGDRSIITRQYFHLSGRRTDVAQELNATWRIVWTVGKETANEELPKIRAIQLEQFELVTAQQAGHPWLADCTAAVLEGSPGYPHELVPGVDYWMTHLDPGAGIYNFAFHGLAVGDVNGDLLDDLYLCQFGGLPNRLFLQRPDGTLRDVTAASGADYLDHTRSALLVDLDNDGDSDLILSLLTGLVMLENNGQAQFTPRARIARVRDGFSLTAADYDRDGLLDIYVCVYYGDAESASQLPLPLPYFDARNGGKNYLIRNLGDWKFADVTEDTGLNINNQRFSFAAAWEDDDQDGDLDLLVVNDFGPNQMFRNEKGRFRDVAPTNGLLDGAFGMSAAFGDYDHDGRQDIYVSNMFSAAGNRVTFQPQFKPTDSPETRKRFQYLARGNSLFRNRGDGSYEDTSVAMGVTMGRWSWGSLFVDINNDRWDDLLVANGFITGARTDDL